MEKYCIYFINPSNGKRIEYLRDLSREEAEQRVYGLRFIKLSPLLEKQAGTESAFNGLVLSPARLQAAKSRRLSSSMLPFLHQAV